MYHAALITLNAILLIVFMPDLLVVRVTALRIAIPIPIHHAHFQHLQIASHPQNSADRAIFAATQCRREVWSALPVILVAMKIHSGYNKFKRVRYHVIPKAPPTGWSILHKPYICWLRCPTAPCDSAKACSQESSSSSELGVRPLSDHSSKDSQSSSGNSGSDKIKQQDD